MPTNILSVHNFPCKGPIHYLLANYRGTVPFLSALGSFIPNARVLKFSSPNSDLAN